MISQGKNLEGLRQKEDHCWIELVCTQVVRPKVQFNYDQKTQKTLTLSVSPDCENDVSLEVSIGTTRTRLLQ
jgi:hypothetical protein